MKLLSTKKIIHYIICAIAVHCIVYIVLQGDWKGIIFVAHTSYFGGKILKTFLYWRGEVEHIICGYLRIYDSFN